MATVVHSDRATSKASGMRIGICADPTLARLSREALLLALGRQGLRATVECIDNSATTWPMQSPAERQPPPIEYALVWQPPPRFFRDQQIHRAIFSMGAGVEGVLGSGVPDHIPLIKLEDGGMAEAMVDYVVAAVVRIHRRLDLFAEQQRARVWRHHFRTPKSTCVVGVLGLGGLGGKVAKALAAARFPVRGFARTAHTIEGVECQSGEASVEAARHDSSFTAFLTGLNVLVSVLPLTPATRGLLARPVLSRLADGAHLINVGRGAHLVEGDLLELLQAGKLGGATLDVVSTQPLPENHPFWDRREITITPHISGTMTIEGAVAEIAGKIAAIERGEAVGGIVDPGRGY